MSSKIINFANKVPLKVANDRVVTLTYAIFNAENDELLEYRENLSYLHGGYENRLITLQSEIEGLVPGSKTEVVLEIDQAFGIYNPELVVTDYASQFPPEANELWAKLEGETEDGNRMEFTVIKVEDDQITVDGNHPFAGKRLKFVVEVKDVRSAEPQELEQGFANDQSTASI